MILLIDNYDSFTYNLYHYIAELGADVKVVRNDKITIDEIIKLNPQGIVISPGPGTPDDAGISKQIISELKGKFPIFGVCMGLQCIGEVFGGRVIRANAPMHGKTSHITHNGKGVFANIPSPFTATRYHSLVVDKATLPDCLEVTAETEDGAIMGLAHKEYQIHGVQFHPESIASEYGHEMIANFLKLYC